MNTQTQTPKPMSFAILRNTHEVFRSSITLMDEAEAAETWQSLKAALGDDFELPGQEPGA